ncbi:sensor histidine kinase [Kutzneria sp. NPDC052558]|uniref:sensor histidine kinase n=1 Tax=Kutzneria sp. NPDC052558 TaxID=3364121 RepID=UPI0037CC01A4
MTDTADDIVRSAAGRPWLRISRWVHLVWLVLIVFQPMFAPKGTTWDWILVGVVVVITMSLYAVMLARPERTRWWFTVPIAVLAILATPFNAGAGTLFVYAAASAGLSESRRDALRWLAGLTILVSLLSLVSTVEWPWRLWGIIPPLMFIWVIGLIQVEHSERVREQAELRLHNARIEHLATVVERERIARDLHDLLGHSLTAVVMRTQLIQSLIAVDPDRAQREAAEVERTARGALDEVRKALSGWRQATLEAELESARTTLTSLGVELTVHRDPGLTIAGATEHELALALREALTNVARHARARTCHIGIETDSSELRLVISDDGIGGTPREGNGLTGLRERITAIGGRVQRLSSSGTTITIGVPLRVAT